MKKYVNMAKRDQEIEKFTDEIMNYWSEEKLNRFKRKKQVSIFCERN